MRALVLFNPASRGGRGRRMWEGIRLGLSRLGVEYESCVLKSIEEACALARNAKGFDAVVAVGGDGTVNAVASGVLQNENPNLKFGVLYAGTSPDFCAFHGIPTEADKALEVLARASARQVEVLQANGMPFFCSCNLGCGAEIARRANSLRKFFGDRLGTFLAMAASFERLKNWSYKIEGKGVLENCNHLLITKMPYIAGGLKLDLPPLNDGEYVIWRTQNLTRAKCLAAIKNMYQGKPCGEFEICSGVSKICCEKGGCAFEFDGDPHGFLPLEIKIFPRKLNLIC